LGSSGAENRFKQLGWLTRNMLETRCFVVEV
jgi:hypothetical protein